MNIFKSMFVMLAAAVLAVSCGKENNEPVVEYLDVTPNNLAGEWQLVEWKGEALNAETYFYIDMIRKDREYVIYQNFDSMGSMPHVITGNYNIETDLELGAIIRGKYDYDGGFWSHEYEVNDLTKTSMTWVAVDDPTFVQKFVRAEIPSDLK